MIIEDKSYQETHELMDPHFMVRVIFRRPIYIERLNKTLAEITGLIMDYDGKQSEFHHPSGSTYRNQIVTHWEFLASRDMKMYRDKKSSEGLTFLIPYDLIKSAELIR